MRHPKLSNAVDRWKIILFYFEQLFRVTISPLFLSLITTSHFYPFLFLLSNIVAGITHLAMRVLSHTKLHYATEPFFKPT